MEKKLSNNTSNSLKWLSTLCHTHKNDLLQLYKEKITDSSRNIFLKYHGQYLISLDELLCYIVEINQLGYHLPVIPVVVEYFNERIQKEFDISKIETQQEETNQKNTAHYDQGNRNFNISKEFDLYKGKTQHEEKRPFQRDICCKKDLKNAFTITDSIIGLYTLPLWTYAVNSDVKLNLIQRNIELIEILTEKKDETMESRPMVCSLEDMSELDLPSFSSSTYVQDICVEKSCNDLNPIEKNIQNIKQGHVDLLEDRLIQGQSGIQNASGFFENQINIHKKNLKLLFYSLCPMELLRIPLTWVTEEYFVERASHPDHVSKLFTISKLFVRKFLQNKNFAYLIKKVRIYCKEQNINNINVLLFKLFLNIPIIGKKPDRVYKKIKNVLCYECMIIFLSENLFDDHFEDYLERTKEFSILLQSKRNKLTRSLLEKYKKNQKGNLSGPLSKYNIVSKKTKLNSEHLDENKLSEKETVSCSDNNNTHKISSDICTDDPILMPKYAISDSSSSEISESVCPFDSFLCQNRLKYFSVTLEQYVLFTIKNRKLTNEENKLIKEFSLEPGAKVTKSPEKYDNKANSIDKITSKKLNQSILNHIINTQRPFDRILQYLDENIDNLSQINQIKCLLWMFQNISEDECSVLNPMVITSQPQDATYLHRYPNSIETSWQFQKNVPQDRNLNKTLNSCREQKSSKHKEVNACQSLEQRSLKDIFDPEELQRTNKNINTKEEMNSNQGLIERQECNSYEISHKDGNKSESNADHKESDQTSIKTGQRIESTLNHNYSNKKITSSHILESYTSINKSDTSVSSTNDTPQSTAHSIRLRFFNKHRESLNKMLNGLTKSQLTNILNGNLKLDCVLTNISAFSFNMKKFYSKIEHKLSAISSLLPGQEKNHFLKYFITDRTFDDITRFQSIQLFDHSHIKGLHLTDILSFCQNNLNEPWFDQLHLLILKDFCSELLVHKTVRNIKNKKLYDKLLLQIKKQSKLMGIDLKIKNIKK